MITLTVITLSGAYCICNGLDVKWRGPLASLSLFSSQYFDPETSFTQSCFSAEGNTHAQKTNKINKTNETNKTSFHLKSFLASPLSKSSLVLKIKNTWLIFIITLSFYITLLQHRKQWLSVTANFGTLSIYKPLWSDSEHTAAELNKNAIFLIQLNWNFRLLFLQFNNLLLRQLNVFHNPLLNSLFN